MLRSPTAAEQRGRRVIATRSVRTILSAEQFRWALERESQRVDRMNAAELSLVLFRVLPGARRLSTMRLAKTILSRIRITDDLGWYDREHIGMLLPETTPASAWPLVQAICDIIAQRGARPLCTVYNYPAGADDVAAGEVIASDPPKQLRVAS